MIKRYIILNFSWCSPGLLVHTLCNGSQFAFLLWTELQHSVDDREQRLPLAARLQEDELQ